MLLTLAIRSLRTLLSKDSAGSLTLLRAMAEARIRNLVYCSSAAVYGMPESLPVAEEQPLDAITPFGSSQLMVERAIPDFAEAHDLSWIVLRLFNAAGADPDGEASPWPSDDTRLMPSTISAAAGERQAGLEPGHLGREG